MPSTDPTSSVNTGQLTRALGEAVIRIWSNLPKTYKITSSGRRSRHKGNPSDRSLPCSCMTSITHGGPIGQPARNEGAGQPRRLAGDRGKSGWPGIRLRA